MTIVASKGAAESLELAIQAAESTLSAFNTEAAPCPACGLSIYENFEDYQAEQSLRAAIRRMKKAKLALEQG